MILTNRRLWPLAPVIIAGVSYLLGSWGAVPRTFTHEDVSGQGIITVDSFSDEAIAMGLLRQRAQTLGLEYLKSSGEHFERWSFYEKGYERWLRNSGLVDEAENRRRYQDQAGAPPEFEVDAWIRRYQEARVRLSLEPVTASLEGGLLSLLRRHQRHTAFTEAYLALLRRAPEHPAIARHARFALSIATDPDASEEILAALQHQVRFACDSHTAERIQSALSEWTQERQKPKHDLATKE
jgi:hypothetical protein